MGWGWGWEVLRQHFSSQLTLLCLLQLCTFSKWVLPQTNKHTHPLTHWNTWMVLLVGKWSLPYLLKEVLQCRSLERAAFLPLLLALPSWSPLWKRTRIHTHIFLLYGIFASPPAVPLSLADHCLLFLSVSLTCAVSQPIYNSHRRRPFFSLLPLTAWS